MHGLEASAARVVELVAAGRAASRNELAAGLGLPPSTVALRVQTLLNAGVLVEQGEGRSHGGRRPRLLTVNSDFGHVWTIDIGSHHVRLGPMDMTGSLIRTHELPIDIDTDPSLLLAEIAAAVHDLAGDEPGRWLGVGVGLPGPVDVVAGTVTLPSRMPGWRGFPAQEALQRHFEQPVVIDNDANLMALGQARRGAPGDTLVVVKAGTGIGSGLVVEGRLHRGRDGAAGDISHVRITAGGDRPCTCGNHGCLETVASGAALVAQLGLASTADVLAATEDADARVITAVRRAGGLLGEVLATVVNFANPDGVLLGGALAGCEAFVAAVRGALYERCLPLATRRLRIDIVYGGADSGLLGAGSLAMESVLDEAIREEAR
ncbi:ROK family transcriptional regulator [Kutzneria buriramensis]|uniref:Putative NBD/HSP70 family sugar kinase n=1 Tax=Kutzneria buriramensis TaxID=1045776 RepID=A0A3E0HGP7_9PSEU|nr:ROK family transcriptional regulator [Kutzneria buriramensis]REH44962.1 putative NBD/HSP70 family sugar kinase [Kutzneria buriramensis]